MQLWARLSVSHVTTTVR